MATEELTIRYPAGFERAVHLTKAEMEQHLRLMAALKMFRIRQDLLWQSSRTGRDVKGRVFEACGRYRVSIFNYPDDEIEASWQRISLQSIRSLSNDFRLQYRATDCSGKT